MKFDERLRGGDRAVSPVIGVVLMVAVTVIVAAVTGAFVFGLGVTDFETAPQAQFTVDYNEGASVPSDGCSTGSSGGVLNITHNGGQSIDVDTLSIVGAGSSSKTWEECSSLSAGDQVSNQESAHIEASSDDIVRLVWQSNNEDSSHTMVTWNGTAET